MIITCTYTPLRRHRKLQGFPRYLREASQPYHVIILLHVNSALNLCENLSYMYYDGCNAPPD